MLKVKSKIKQIHKYYKSKKTSHFVKKYYKKNKKKAVIYKHNIWNNNRYWDFFYQSLPHAIKSDYYVPYDYFAYKIEPNLNDKRTSIISNGKNWYDQIFDDLVIMPKTIFRSMNYIFLDSNYKNINNIQAFLKNSKIDFIIKQSLFSHGGKSIYKIFYDEEKDSLICNLKEMDINFINKNLSGNFIAQEVVEQHEDIAKYHPYSLNTIRLLSYRSIITNKVHVLIKMLRMGVNQSFIDNASIDGIAVGINDDSTLKKYAFSQYGKYYAKHPDTKVAFEGNYVPNLFRVEQKIKQLANLVPYQRLIGWDFAINKEGEPVLIELNTGVGVWMLQLANGRPLFGSFTKEIYDFLEKK